MDDKEARISEDAELIVFKTFCEKRAENILKYCDEAEAQLEMALGAVCRLSHRIKSFYPHLDDSNPPPDTNKNKPPTQ